MFNFNTQVFPKWVIQILISSGIFIFIVKEAAKSYIKFKKFTSVELYKKRQKVIHELNSKLVKLHFLINKYVSPMHIGGQEQLFKLQEDIVDLFNSFVFYFYTHRYYLPEDFDRKIKDLIDLYKEIFWNISMALEAHTKEKITEWQKGLKKFTNDVEPYFNEIVYDLRTLIGLSKSIFLCRINFKELIYFLLPAGVLILVIFLTVVCMLIVKKLL